METSLHRELKERYGQAMGGRSEVVLKGFRVDALTSDGTVIEVQSGALGPLRPKLRQLLPDHVVRVVKPVVMSRRVVRRTKRDGDDLSARLSPKRGQLVDVFDDLIGLVRVFPHPNLRVDVLCVDIDEVRVPRRRWPGYQVVDRILRQVNSTITLTEPRDLFSLLPRDISSPFTTLDLAESLGKPVHFAQRVAYCLRLSRAVDVFGKNGNRIIYTRTADSASDLEVQTVSKPPTLVRAK